MSIVRLKRKIVEGGSYFARPSTGIEFTPSGSKMLDIALGGGWAVNRVINIVGDKATGKTLLAIEAAANFAIKYPRGKIRYRESESAFLKDYAGALGMPLDRVDFGRDRLDTVEDLFEDIAHYNRRAKEPELYICDSLDALSDRSEMERAIDAPSYGAQKAKKVSELFRRMIREMGSKMTLIIISQVRDKIGVTFGRSTMRTGGRAMDFYASQVVYLAHMGQLKRTIQKIERVVGVSVKAKVDKNKVGLPFREAAFNITFGYGIDDVTSCLTWLKEVGSLNELGVASDGIKEFARTLMGMSDEIYLQTIRDIHKVVERRSQEIENTFLPKRLKYGR